MLVVWEPVVFLDYKDHKDLKEPLEIQEFKDLKDPPVLEELKEKPDLLDLQEIPIHASRLIPSHVTRLPHPLEHMPLSLHGQLPPEN